MLGFGCGKLKQLSERPSASLMQSRTQPHLYRFQIEGRLFPARHQDYREERLEFPRDLSMDRNNRFFPSSVHPNDTACGGRSRQICSLTAVSSLTKS